MARKAQGTRFRSGSDPLAAARKVTIGVVILAIVVVAALLAIHIHGNGPGRKATGTTTTTPTPTRQPAQKLIPIAPSTAATLTSLSATSDLARAATFRARYASQDVPGAPPTVLIEQMPSRQRFRAGPAELFVEGANAYYCTTAQVSDCRSEPSAGASPLGRLIGLYDAATYATTLNSVKHLLQTGAVTDFSSAHRIIAGQPSDCASWRHEHSTLNYCVTPGGILAEFTISPTRATAATFSIRLESYSTHVAAADFALPKGAQAGTVSSGRATSSTVKQTKTSSAKSSK